MMGHNEVNQLQIRTAQETKSREQASGADVQSCIFQNLIIRFMKIIIQPVKANNKFLIINTLKALLFRFFIVCLQSIYKTGFCLCHSV